MQGSNWQHSPPNLPVSPSISPFHILFSLLFTQPLCKQHPRWPSAPDPPGPWTSSWYATLWPHWVLILTHLSSCMEPTGIFNWLLLNESQKIFLVLMVQGDEDVCGPQVWEHPPGTQQEPKVSLSLLWGPSHFTSCLLFNSTLSCSLLETMKWV